MSSWRESTRKQYGVHINRWTKFCAANGFNPVQVNVSAVLRFLTEVYEQNCSYSSVNTARCALSSFLILNSGHTIGTHPLVSRFLKGVYNLSPPAPRYREVWDVKLVLNYLRSYPHVTTLRLRDLTLKLCMLIALVSAQRCQTLHLLRIDNMKVTSNSIVFVIRDLVKQSKPGNTGFTLVLKEYPPEKSLCVCHALKQYLLLTESCRGDTKQLFISHRKPYGAVSKDTISRWIRTVLHDSGVDTTIFKAHSTRAASSSAANEHHVPISDIMATAGWASEKTFRTYYNKPIHQEAQNNFAEAVLKSGNESVKT